MLVQREIVRAARPARVYLFADGPRATGDLEACRRAREAATGFDWGGEVRTRFLDRNLGCGLGPATAFSWFFENEPEGIVLEDDLVPRPEFFPFCAELLERYREERRVMQVCGTNRLGAWERDGLSYHASRWGSSSGWASWRRAWAHHDHQARAWAEAAVRRRLREVYRTRLRVAFLSRMLGLAARGGPGVTWWDYQWALAMCLEDGLALVPARSLVDNVGNDAESTHDREAGHTLAALEAGGGAARLAFPLRHPEVLAPDAALDEALLRRSIRPRDLLSSWLPWPLKRRLKALLLAGRSSPGRGAVAATRARAVGERR